ncbi:hypothetical protein quinque_002352 [Culex quinquefasciatus]
MPGLQTRFGAARVLLEFVTPDRLEKPQLPIRRKCSPYPNYSHVNFRRIHPKTTKQLKRRYIKNKTKENAEKSTSITTAGNPEGDVKGAAESDKDDDDMSDADVEDNLNDDLQPKKIVHQTWADRKSVTIAEYWTQFIAVELMAGNNKVCCDACTEWINSRPLTTQERVSRTFTRQPL